jgi:hypothetical protein
MQQWCLAYCLALSLSLEQEAAPAARPPPLMSPPHLDEEKACTYQQVMISVMTRSMARQPPAWTEAPPGQR